MHTTVRRRWKTSVAGLAAAAAVVGLAACSSSGSSSSTAAASTSTSASSAASSTVSSSASLHSELPADLQDQSSIPVAAVSDYPPLSYSATGSTTIVGFDIDLLNDAAKLLGTSFDYENTSYESLIPALQAKRFVLAEGGAADTATNEKVTTMIDYLSSDVQLAVLPGNPSGLKSLPDACGFTIATLAGSPDYLNLLDQYSAKCTAEGKAKITVDTFESEDESVLALEAGRVQATLDGNFSNAYRIKTGEKMQLVPGTYLDTPIGFQVLPSQGQFAKALSDAINQLIANGTFKQLMAKWSLAGSPTQAGINLSSKS